MDGPLKLRLLDRLPLPHSPPSANLAHSRRSVFSPNWPPQSVSSPPHWHTAATFRRPVFGWRDLRKSTWRRSDVAAGERRPFMAIVGFLSDLDVVFLPPIANPASDKDSKIEGRFIMPSSPSYFHMSDAIERFIATAFERRSWARDAPHQSGCFREALFYIGSHLSVKARRGSSDPRQNTSTLKFSQATSATLKRPPTHIPQFGVGG